jgi:hypothetical protein
MLPVTAHVPVADRRPSAWPSLLRDENPAVREVGETWREREVARLPVVVHGIDEVHWAMP